MKCNVGGADRVMRVVLGLVALALGLYLKTWWGLVGVPLLLTAVFGYCPAYEPFKISSAKPKS
jgi:type IV secretory pathway TrbD component